MSPMTPARFAIQPAAPRAAAALTWHALAEARRRVRRRLPFVVDGEPVGSVAEAHLGALKRWHRWLRVGPQAVELTAPRPARDEAFAEMNAALRAQGLVRAWRDEPFPLLSPSSGRVLAVFERASARFWGTLTLGAHCNGWVASADGSPAALWIARRSPSKATDPDKLDNLIGGGVPHGQTPLQTLVREGAEEAGLSARQMAGAVAVGVLELHRDVAEGLQFERLHVYDLQLPDAVTPLNQDGEVSAIERLAPDQVASLASAGEMTVDAALVTLHFLLRRNCLDPETARLVGPRLEQLRA